MLAITNVSFVKRKEAIIHCLQSYNRLKRNGINSGNMENTKQSSSLQPSLESKWGTLYMLIQPRESSNGIDPVWYSTKLGYITTGLTICDSPTVEESWIRYFVQKKLWTKVDVDLDKLTKLNIDIVDGGHIQPMVTSIVFASKKEDSYYNHMLNSLSVDVQLSPFHAEAYIGSYDRNTLYLKKCREDARLTAKIPVKVTLEFDGYKEDDRSKCLLRLLTGSYEDVCWASSL